MFGALEVMINERWFTINLNKKQIPIYFIFNETIESDFSRANSVEAILELESLKLYLIGKSNIWFYYCVLKVVTINNNESGKSGAALHTPQGVQVNPWPAP